MPSTELLTIDETADRMRVSVSTLRHMRSKGSGPAAAKIGRRLMYRSDEVDAWIADRFNEGRQRHSEREGAA